MSPPHRISTLNDAQELQGQEWFAEDLDKIFLINMFIRKILLNCHTIVCYNLN